MKILLVDDSEVVRELEKKVLAALGRAEFVEANDGVEALEIIRSGRHKFDVALIDWNMPNMDGITLVGKIREKDKTTPLIMATSEAERSRVLEAIRAGVNNYVVKPFSPETLVEKVRQTLAKAAA